ncbi:MAG: L-rhamnose mutarotase [Clostridia bacterium]
MMERRAFVFKLEPGMKAEYIRRHREIWPEMRAMLKDAGIRNYSIWYCGGRLFGYYESDDLNATDAFKAASPIQQNWNRYMEGLIVREPGEAPEQVFLLE